MKSIVLWRAAILTLVLLAVAPVGAQPSLPFADARGVASSLGFDETVRRLQAAVGANGMLLLSTASASQGAANSGFTIPGNAVLFVFRNDFARRLLAENVAAGFEAPLRLYVTERPGAGVIVEWRRPSGLFAAYGSAPAVAIGTELDAILEKIVAEALR
jgi:uncharacterized protein (DUF302 family)